MNDKQRTPRLGADIGEQSKPYLIAEFDSKTRWISVGLIRFPLDMLGCVIAGDPDNPADTSRCTLILKNGLQHWVDCPADVFYDQLSKAFF